MKTNRPLRVLQVIGVLSVGGAESWLLALLRHWSQTGAAAVDFLLTGGKQSSYDKDVEALGGKIHYVRYGRGSIGSFMREFRRILRQGNYDAIHDHSDFASGWHFLLGSGVLPPVRVMHIHNTRNQFRINYERTAARRLSGRLGRALASRLATHVCGTSAQVLREYGYEPGKPGRPHVTVLHCGFEIAMFYGPRADDRASVLHEFGFGKTAKLLFHAGRLDYQFESNHHRNHKNTWLVVEIAREAARRDSEIALLIAGAGDRQRAQIEERIATWGLANRLRLIGVRSDIGRLMRAADIVLFPSKEEGLGMVAVEAQAAGTPVLTSTAVSREACIIPELFHALPLDKPLAIWTETLFQILNAPRLDTVACCSAVEASPFSIANSARLLEAVYGSGER
jgi:glycosyltransferase EpsF